MIKKHYQWFGEKKRNYEKSFTSSNRSLPKPIESFKFHALDWYFSKGSFLENFATRIEILNLIKTSSNNPRRTINKTNEKFVLRCSPTSRESEHKQTRKWNQFYEHNDEKKFFKNILSWKMRSGKERNTSTTHMLFKAESSHSTSQVLARINIPFFFYVCLTFYMKKLKKYELN